MGKENNFHKPKPKSYLGAKSNQIFTLILSIIKLVLMSK